MASLFSTLRSELSGLGYLTRSKQARDWFIERVKELNGRINRKTLLTDSELKMKKTPMAGFMYMFVYDAKLKETLPYFDRFPLILLLQPAEGGFLGLNLHYLQPALRAAFLDKLMSTMSGDALTERSRLRLRYSLLASAKQYREFKPCIKHYLTDHIKSRISLVSAPDWETAIFLPTEHFSGAQKSKVWMDSRKSI